MLPISEEAIKIINNWKNNKNINLIEMKYLIRKFGKSKSLFKINKTVYFYDTMNHGSYVLNAKYGDVYSNDFNPYYTPEEMLCLGIMEGKYINDCILEFPKEWFLNAIKKNKLSPEYPNPNINLFKVKSRQSLHIWKDKQWIIGQDKRGWIQWYFRYYLGRRDKKVDDIQKKRWRAIIRHSAQIIKNKPDNIKNKKDKMTHRPKQRQTLLQWSHNPWI